jgi:hypothetical protein
MPRAASTMSDDDSALAVATVRDYLRLVEARDLEAAATRLSADVEITFPGGRVFTTLEDQVRSSAGRFRSVRKSFDRFDVVSTGEDSGETVVYAIGTLSGVGLDDTTFEGVRFVDRFTLRAGAIVDQMVWNDLAERGIPPASEGA